jgi:hypothetical protein
LKRASTVKSAPLSLRVGGDVDASHTARKRCPVKSATDERAFINLAPILT